MGCLIKPGLAMCKEGLSSPYPSFWNYMHIQLPLFKAATLSHGGQWGNPVTSGMLSVNLFYFWAKGLETALKLPVSIMFQ